MNDKRKKFLRILAISGVCGLLFIFVLLVPTAFIMQFIDVSDRICALISCLILFSGAFFSGFSGGFFTRKKGMATGGLCGAIVCVCMFVINLILSFEFVKTAVFLKFLLCIISGSIGGVIGVNKRVHEGVLSSLKGIISV